MLSSYPFFCLPFQFPPCTMPCRIIFADPFDFFMCPCHLNVHFVTVVTFIQPNSMHDTVPHFTIRKMISIGDAKKTSKASNFCSVYLTL